MVNPHIKYWKVYLIQKQACKTKSLKINQQEKLINKEL